MTPWHRFWFPHGDGNGDGPAPTRDAALWTPQAIAETQRELWKHAGQATEDWWRYWRSVWPRLPAQPPVGVVTPPMPAEQPAPAEARAQQPLPARPRRSAARAEPSVAAKPGVTAAKRARPVTRGR